VGQDAHRALSRAGGLSNSNRQECSTGPRQIANVGKSNNVGKSKAVSIPQTSAKSALSMRAHARRYRKGGWIAPIQ
jgi:hypothetical protein